MATIMPRIAAAFAISVAVVALLAGCVVTPNSSITADVGAAVSKAVPEAHATLVGISSDGSPDRRAVLVKVYIGSHGPANVAPIVDRTLKAAWASSPVEPVSVGVAVVRSEKPADASTAQVDGVDLSGAVKSLGFEGRWLGLRDLIVSSYGMVKEYGAWK